MKSCTFLVGFYIKKRPKIGVIFHELRSTNDTDRPKMPHKCHYNKGGKEGGLRNSRHKNILKRRCQPKLGQTSSVKINKFYYF